MLSNELSEGIRLHGTMLQTVRRGVMIALQEEGKERETLLKRHTLGAGPRNGECRAHGARLHSQWTHFHGCDLVQALSASTVAHTEA